MKKIAVVLVILLCCIGLLCACGSDDDQTALRDQLYRLESERAMATSAYERERQTLLDRMNKAGHAFLGFSYADEILYTEVMPLFVERDLTGTIFFSETEMPGMAGNITWEQLKEMMQSGWKAGLTVTVPEDDVWGEEARAGLADRVSVFAEQQIPVVSLYITGKTVPAELSVQMTELGIDLYTFAFEDDVNHLIYPERGDQYAERVDEQGVMGVPAVYFGTGTTYVTKNVQDVINNVSGLTIISGPIASENSEDAEGMVEWNTFANMLKYLLDQDTADKLRLVDISEYRTQRENYAAEYQEVAAELEVLDANYQALCDRIDAEYRAVMQQME